MGAAEGSGARPDRAECVVETDAEFAAGSTDEEGFDEEDWERVDLGGCLVLPGLSFMLSRYPCDNKRSERVCPRRCVHNADALVDMSGSEPLEVGVGTMQLRPLLIDFVEQD